MVKTGPNAEPSHHYGQFYGMVQMEQLTNYKFKSDFNTNLYNSICNAKTLFNVFSTKHHLQTIELVN